MSSVNQSTQTSTPVSRLSSVDFTQAESFRMYIENEVLKVITEVVEKGGEKGYVQAMAQLVLDLIHPGMTIEELYVNTAKLDDAHTEFAPVVFAIMKEYEEKYEKRALESVSHMVKNGRYDDAQDLVKKVLAYKSF